MDFARTAGVTAHTVKAILREPPGSGRTVYSVTAKKIMSVRLIERAKDYVVDATLTRRRVEALMLMGWSRQQVAQACGLAATTLMPVNLDKGVLLSTEAAVQRAYRHLHLRVGDNKQARETGLREGYVHWSAWNSQTFGDPMAIPDLSWVDDPAQRERIIARCRALRESHRRWSKGLSG